MSKTKKLTLAAMMAALATILSLDLFVIPIAIGPFSSKIHFTQLPIFISGFLAGPWIGLLTGAIGGIYMSFSVGIPFIIGGLALLGFSTGLFAKKMKLNPFFSSILAWCVQAPYVFVTDYAWFVVSGVMPSPAALTVVTTILVNLTVEAIISSFLAEVVIRYIKRIGLTFE
jgi:uncharacterized membrane protein